jgi:outer membrane usher protein
LAEYGVRVKAFPELVEDKNGCANLSVIPDTKADFDFTAQRLNISIPQAAYPPPRRDIFHRISLMTASTPCW